MSDKVTNRVGVTNRILCVPFDTICLCKVTNRVRVTNCVLSVLFSQICHSKLTSRVGVTNRAETVAPALTHRYLRLQGARAARGKARLIRQNKRRFANSTTIKNIRKRSVQEEVACFISQRTLRRTYSPTKPPSNAIFIAPSYIER